MHLQVRSRRYFQCVACLMCRQSLLSYKISLCCSCVFPSFLMICLWIRIITKKSRPLKRRRDVIPWYHSHLPAQSASLILISHGLPGYILPRCASAVISPAVTGGPVGTYLSFSKTVQSCHSKAIFHLCPPVSSQPHSGSTFHFL